MIKYVTLTVFALTVAYTFAYPATAETTINPYGFYLEDAWDTIMDNNETGKWKQEVSATGTEISTIWRAGCIENQSVCLQSERTYPSGDIVREFIPFDI